MISIHINIYTYIQPKQPTSIERVIFPAMAREGKLFDLALAGYWMDVGKPSDFLNGQLCFYYAWL